MADAVDLQRQLVEFVRAFGLHQPDRTACGQPISTSEAHALGVLADEAPLRISELAGRLILEKSTVSRLVSSLAEKGWIRTSPDPSDARARLIELSASGRRAAERLKAARNAHFESVLRAIAPGRRNAVIGGLAELTRAARSLDEKEGDVRSA